MKKYIPILILALGLFFAGRWTSADDSKGELEKLKKDREILIKGIIQKQVRETALIKLGQEIEQKRINDSLYYADRLQENKRAYSALKKKYNEINLNRATVHELDSIVAALYGR